MLSYENKFIFVHVAKTAGSSVLEALLPYSNAKKTIGYGISSGHWGISDPATPTMHGKISEYQRHLGHSFDEYKIVAGFRDPFERLVSMYFSPHRWKKPSALGRVSLKIESYTLRFKPISNGTLGRALDGISPMVNVPPIWNEHKFVNLVESTPSHSDMLRRVDGLPLEENGVIALRFGHLDFDFQRACIQLGLPEDLSIQTIGGGVGQRQDLQKILKSKELRHFTLTHFKEDLERYGKIIEVGA